MYNLLFSPRLKKKKYIKKENFINIIDKIQNKNEKTISLYNYWEPLMHPQIWFFVKYAKQNWIKKIKIATNGTFLDTKKSLELINSWLDYLSISVDWSNQNVYEKFRVWWNLNLILNNIKKIVKLKQKLWKWPIIELQFIIMSHNENQINNILILAKKLWIDILRYKTVLIKNKKWSFLKPNNKSYSRYEWIAKNYCNKPKEWIVVNVDWNVIPCCYITDKQIEKYTLWNINKNNLIDIFNSKKSQNFVKQVINNKTKLDYCNNCQEWNLNLDYKIINFQWWIQKIKKLI